MLSPLLLTLTLAGSGCGQTTRDADPRDIGVAGTASGGTDNDGAASGGTVVDGAPGGRGGTAGGGVADAGAGGASAGRGGSVQVAGGGGADVGAGGASAGRGGTTQVGADAGAGGVSAGAAGAPGVACRPRDDPTGYLVSICEYLVAHADTIFTGVDPNSYNIERVESGTEDGRDVLYVWLDCCFMGDYATIDAETGEVIAFSVGDV